MAKTQTFQYSISYRDPKDSDNDVLITDVTSVQAVDIKHAERVALSKLDNAQWGSKLAHIEVTVRPFIGPAAEPKSGSLSAPAPSARIMTGSNPSSVKRSGKPSYELIERRSQQGSAVVVYTVGLNTSYRVGEMVFEVRREPQGLSVLPTKDTLANFEYEDLKTAAEWVFKQAQKY